MENLSDAEEATSDIDVVGNDPNNDAFYARSTTDCLKEMKDECTVLVEATVMLHIKLFHRLLVLYVASTVHVSHQTI